MFFSGTQTRSHLKWLVISIVVVAGVSSLPFRSFAYVNDPEPVAQIFAVLWRNDEVPHMTPGLVTITRGPGGCPPAEFISKGVPLCKGDKVKTARDVRVKILFGDPKNKNEVTVEERSEITISSIWCGRLCRWFASLTGQFDNRVQHVGLTNKSTVYEVLSHRDGSIELMVFEGVVEVTKLPPDAAGDPGSNPTAEASPSPGSPNNVLDTVPRLFKLIINPDGSVAEKLAMTHEKLCSALEFSTAAEILLYQTPAEVGGNVAKFTNYESIGRRNNTFQTARCASFWEPSQGQHFETLGYIYNDWGNGEKALEMFAKAVKLYGAPPADKLTINKAEALRQIREYDQALTEVQAVLARTDSSLMGSALNLRGNIFYDQARKELLYNRTDEGLAKARELLAKASADYDQALPLAGSQRQYIEVNRGQILKTEGDIAQREGDYARAETRYIEAIKKMMEAYGYDGDNPRNQIATLLVARARAALANAYALMGKPVQSKAFYDKAQATYEGAIEDAKLQEQNFAAPYCGLASLFLIRGNDKAAENYAQCFALSTGALVRDVPVPNVIGLRRAAAIQTLAEAGLEPEIVEDGGIVETQEPAVESVVKVGTKIKVKLRRGEEDPPG